MPQRFYQKASVQVAMVSAAGLIIVTSFTIWHQRSQLKSDNQRLLREVSAKTAEVQRLETVLTPFRTIALERFTGPESEALKKLADQMLSIERELSAKTVQIDQLRQELDRSDPNNQPIRTASAKVEIHVASGGAPGGLMDMQLHAVVGLGHGERPLFVLRNRDLLYQKKSVRDEVLSFTFTAQKDLTEDFGVQTMETLAAAADTMLIVFSPFSDNTRIVGGNVTFTFNGAIRRTIPIPTQIYTKGVRAPVRDAMLVE